MLKVFHLSLRSRFKFHRITFHAAGLSEYQLRTGDGNRLSFLLYPCYFTLCLAPYQTLYILFGETVYI